MSKFIVNAEFVNVLDKDGVNQKLLKNKEYNVADYQSDSIIPMTGNGIKDEKGEWMYKPTIEILGDEKLTPTNLAMDAEESTKQGIVINKKAKTK
jgi:hypothetical protein